VEDELSAFLTAAGSRCFLRETGEAISKKYLQLHLGIDREDMTDLPETKLNPGRKVQWDFTFAFLVLRLWLSVRTIFVGIEKFGAYRSVAPLQDRMSVLLRQIFAPVFPI